MPDDDSPRASLNSLCVTSGRRCVFGGCGNESEEAERIREQSRRLPERSEGLLPPSWSRSHKSWPWGYYRPPPEESPPWRPVRLLRRSSHCAWCILWFRLQCCNRWSCARGSGAAARSVGGLAPCIGWEWFGSPGSVGEPRASNQHERWCLPPSRATCRRRAN